MSVSQQLLLTFNNEEDLTFDNFFSNKALSIIVSMLKEQIYTQQTDSIVISGEAAMGKTHLLKAACLFAYEHNVKPLYLPLRVLASYHPESVLTDLERFHFLCIDDCDSVAGNLLWEEALFNLYNTRLDQGLPILYSMQRTAIRSSFLLEDLKSRLTACLGFHIKTFTDDEKIHFLQFQAKQKGMDLSLSSAEYILRRYNRDLNSLHQLIEKLAEVTLIESRRLTVPFIKSFLN